MDNGASAGNRTLRDVVAGSGVGFGTSGARGLNPLIHYLVHEAKGAL